MHHSPRGVFRQPHIPILVGGSGEKRTLRTLARYGDVMNLDGWAGGPMDGGLSSPQDRCAQSTL